MNISTASYSRLANASVMANSFEYRIPIALRASFYLFVFSVPFETVDLLGISQYLSLARVSGLFFAATTLLSPKICYARPPKPFWFFAAFLFIVTLRELFLANPFDVGVVGYIYTLFQDLIFFWLAGNLMKNSEVGRGAIITLTIALILEALFTYFGIGLTVIEGIIYKRYSAFEQDPNGQGYLYVLGLYCLLFFNYKPRNLSSLTFNILKAVPIALLTLQLINTGSRGALLAYGLTGLVVVMASGSMKRRIKLMAGIGIIFSLALVMLFNLENARARWDMTLETKSMAGRDIIMLESIHMIGEKPIFGWGAYTNFEVLANRLRVNSSVRDTHNDILFALTATGFSGGLLFIIGLFLCFRDAWRARRGKWRSLPLALVISTLLVGSSITIHKRKQFWIVMSVAVASVQINTKRRSREEISALRFDSIAKLQG